MAAFASDRRSGWVRVLVLILCALFIFATVATPPAYAAGETVALFGLAAVLSAATAALGFKLANNTEGQATLQKMVQDFTGASIAAGLVLTGSKVNGLINGMQYIKMAVHNGKTYLDERIFAWCQQWLAQNGVYDANTDDTITSLSLLGPYSTLNLSSAPEWYPISFSVLEKYLHSEIVSCVGQSAYDNNADTIAGFPDTNGFILVSFNKRSSFVTISIYHNAELVAWGYNGSNYIKLNCDYVVSYTISGNLYVDTKWNQFVPAELPQLLYLDHNYDYSSIGAKVLAGEKNTTGLSGTDTLGKDVIDLTLDQILEKLKEWAQDWYDAGADSVTNAATGAKDLPLSVATGAATANPALNPDDVYNPPFALPLPGLRSGETDSKTVEQGKENASAAETSTVDVAENQTVVNSLVSWALNYIDPDTGLFSKFPLCVPYDAYLLVTSSLGVDAVGSDSIFGASPGDLDGVVTESIDTYSDFQPIININNDFELDGKTYPISISIDLTPWQPLVTFFREGMALLLIAELIGSEYKRIRGH